jgi:flagellar hook-basal body complex protein FliE
VTDAIGSVRVGPALAPGAAPQPGAAGAPGFGESLEKLLDTVESSSQSANRAVEHMLHGTGDVHEAMIALQRAELTLQLTVQLRNKLVQAYQDIMRMPV